MRLIKLFGILLVSPFILVGGPLAPASAKPSPAAAPRFEPDCRVTVDNPHRSSGAGGIISKGRITCSAGIALTYEDVRVSLYTGCRNTLPATKPFTRFDCNKITTASYGTEKGKAGGTVTLYVPKSGTSGHPNVAGYHRAYIEYQYPGSSTEYKTSSQQVSGVL